MIHYILGLELCLVIDHCYPLKISTKDGVSMCKASFNMEIHGQCWTYIYKSQGCIIAIYTSAKAQFQRAQRQRRSFLENSRVGSRRHRL